MYEKSRLWIIFFYRYSSYSGHISDALSKTKEHIKQLLSNSWSIFGPVK